MIRKFDLTRCAVPGCKRANLKLLVDRNFCPQHFSRLAACLARRTKNIFCRRLGEGSRLRAVKKAEGPGPCSVRYRRHDCPDIGSVTTVLYQGFPPLYRLCLRHFHMLELINGEHSFWLDGMVKGSG